MINSYLTEKANELAKATGLSVVVKYDEFAESPRQWDNLATTVGRSHIHDEIYPSEVDIGNNIEETVANYFDYMNLDIKQYVWLPIYKYEHSGIAYSNSPFSCRWDSGVDGFMYVSKEDIRNCYSCKRITKAILEKVYKVFAGELAELQAWVNGEVYTVTVNDTIGHLDTICGVYEDGIQDVVQDMLSSNSPRQTYKFIFNPKLISPLIRQAA